MDRFEVSYPVPTPSTPDDSPPVDKHRETQADHRSPGASQSAESSSSRYDHRRQTVIHHLEQALPNTTDSTARYHLREALQLLEIEQWSDDD